LLHRRDCIVDILDGATGLIALTITATLKESSPAKRRIHAWEGDYQLVKEPLLVAIDPRAIAVV
jgi:hypothetical protein